MREYDLAKQHMTEQLHYAENERLLSTPSLTPVRNRLLGFIKLKTKPTSTQQSTPIQQWKPTDNL